jgi:RNA polymerase sigma-70 factor, ECF subfamily
VITAGASDAELVDAAQRGDRAAMDELLRRHYDRVRAVCRRIAGSSRDADDAAQEAMIRIVRNLDRFDGRSAFGTWAYRIATNAAIDELRKRSRRPALHVVHDMDDDHTREQADPMAHREVEAAPDRMAIEEALAALPEDFRLPVVMRDVGDLDYAEIAVELSVPIGTVKSRIARGRKMLLEHLGTEHSGEAGNRGHPGGRPTPVTPRPADRPDTAGTRPRPPDDL